ncbi:MAG: aminoacyl-tRNA hydrolase [Paludibacteraceae bacterium]|nr:aminoacyl-tRNA hydrolase [Paludibacteraceae bacterium]
MKYLICGLGNIGDEYRDTRHNVGFLMLDAFAQASNVVFEDKRFGFVGRTRVKNAEIILLKPSTFMNLSGNAVRYWLQAEKIPIENLLVLVDDLNLPFGTLRLRLQGSNGGHNGLGHIQQVLGTHAYARLRLGIGNDYQKGTQINFVLGTWTPEEKAIWEEKAQTVREMIVSFCLQGGERTMTLFNTRHGGQN